MPEDDERDLIARAQAGEAIAFERLAEQHAARLWRCALALGKDAHWAEDLAQETLVEAWRSLGRFDGRCRFSTWLYGVLRHRFLKGRRQQNAAKVSDPDSFGQVACTAYTPDRSAEASEDAGRVRQAVASLPEEHRLVVELRFFAGATLDEIAAALDCPLGTVKSRLHYALEKLRQMDLAVNLFTRSGESRESKP
jgi:RNA polymerase sigma-70 factor (ECF subfamily)